MFSTYTFKFRLTVDVFIVEVGTVVSISCTAFSRSVRPLPAACAQY